MGAGKNDVPGAIKAGEDSPESRLPVFEIDVLADYGDYFNTFQGGVADEAIEDFAALAAHLNERWQPRQGYPGLRGLWPECPPGVGTRCARKLG